LRYADLRGEVMKLATWWQALKETFNAWNQDRAPRLGAALAYYSTFSLAPFLLIVISVAGLVFGEEAASGEIVAEIGSAIGPEAAQAIEKMVENVYLEDAGLWATIVGVALLIVGASGVFLQLQDALNSIWKVKPKPGQGFMGLIRSRLLSFSVILGTGFLFLISLVVSAALNALGKYFSHWLPIENVHLLEILHVAVSLVVITALFAMIFKVLPDVILSWNDVWIGAAFTAVLFTLGKYLIGLYLGRGTVASTFGAAGTLVVLLLWVYYSSLILLFGAEFTRVYTNRWGSRVVPADYAMEDRAELVAAGERQA
jgi:membrane protein